jgi:hypothetical protein
MPTCPAHSKWMLRVFSTGIVLTALCLAALAQAPAPSASPDSQPPIRDAGAMTIIQAALNAMGGNAGWSELHRAITTGSYVRNGDTGTIAFTWSDDWTGEARMRRDEGSSNGGPHRLYLQDAGSAPPAPSPSSAVAASNTVPRPHFDNVPALIAHLPGAALFLALQNPAYAITMATPSRLTPPNTSCVRIRRTPATTAMRVDDISMCFSADTSLPVSAYVSLPDLFHPNYRLLESIQYDKFQRVDNVLLPRQISITNPAKQTKTITITSASWNPAFTDRTFSGAAQ